MPTTPTAPATPRVAFYEGAARYALGEAIRFREQARRTGAPIDRVIMRSFARQWRLYSARARAAT